MLDNLTKHISGAIDRLRGKRFLSESDIDEALSEIRIALLEADVSLSVVKEIHQNIKAKATGTEIIKSVDPAHMVIKIVQDEIEAILKSDKSELNINKSGLTIILMLGLQGAGKTTTSAKLGYLLKEKHGKKVLTASLDTQRPAAKEQLALMSQKAGVDSLEIIAKEHVEKITKRAIKEAKSRNYDILILDTAGRITLDKELMKELKEVSKIASPHESLLVVDSLTGQDAVNIAKGFMESVDVTGIIMTRLDGDPRGGAMLSMKHVTGKPIKFIGSGEKTSDLEDFKADRVASRIVDMGDIISLVENAEKIMSEKDADDLKKKLETGEFDLEDLLAQLKNMKKMGGMMSMLKFIPGAGKIKEMMNNANVDESMLEKQEAIILSMTKKERRRPKLVETSGARKKRIANGSGTTIQDVNRVIKKHKEMQEMMKKVGKKGLMNPSSMTNEDMLKLMKNN